MKNAGVRARRLSAMVLCLLAVVVASAAGAPSLKWQVQGLLTYDDNPYQYSPSDLDAFRLRENPARFPIRSSDDIDANIGAGVNWRYELFGRYGSVGLRTKLHQYYSNPEKSYGLAAIDAEQTVWESGAAEASYLYMPDRLIRHYRNPSPTDEYIGCRFSEHLTGAGLRQRLGTLSLSPEYHFEYDDYAAPFDYYDTRAHRAGTEARWEPVRNFSLSLDYEYKLAKAQGPAPDISYNQHEAGLTLLTRPKKLYRFSVEAGYAFARREFTTRNSGDVDPVHAGRVDNTSMIHVELQYRLTGIALVTGYEYEWREVTSPYSVQADEVKAYRHGRLSIGVTLSSGRGG